MEAVLRALEADAAAVIAAADGPEALEQARIRVFGKKGLLAAGLPDMRAVPADQKRHVGQLRNEITRALEAAFEQRRQAVEAAAAARSAAAQRLDVTLPGRIRAPGRHHPLEVVRRELIEIFCGLGFSVVDGPEVELAYFNFTALAIPEDHPARDDRDSFYVTDDVVLRTETSAVQIRTMETHEPPVRIIAPGRVYRRDAVDATHCHTFHQVEGLLVDEGVSFADLKGTLYAFCAELFGEGVIVRFTPDYFPFTEPSAQMGVWWAGDGISTDPADPRGRWLELGGMGMVDPQVLDNVGYDSERYTGFAFGLGIDRMAMLKYGIDDIRLFFENDLRFLSQF